MEGRSSAGVQSTLPFLVLDEEYCAAVLESGAMEEGGAGPARRCVEQGVEQMGV
jgi:hypothetical protein